MGTLKCLLIISDERKLYRRFPRGLSYSESVNLCVALFCSTSWLPEVNPHDCTKDGLALAFSELARKGKINQFNKTIAIKRGADKVDVSASKHWIEIIDSAMKSGFFYDTEMLERLLSHASPD